MACRSCGNRKNKTTKGVAYPKSKKIRYTVMGNYKFLKQNQIDKRLETFKRMYCKDCEQRYTCDFKMYNECKKVEK